MAKYLATKKKKIRLFHNIFSGRIRRYGTVDYMYPRWIVCVNYVLVFCIIPKDLTRWDIRKNKAEKCAFWRFFQFRKQCYSLELGEWFCVRKNLI